MLQLPTKFPLLRPASARAAARFDDAVEALRRGLAAGEIRNAVLDEVKFELGAVVRRAWEVQVAEPFFHCGRYEGLPPAVYALDDGLVSGLHDALLKGRKVAKCTEQHPAVAAMRAVLAEALPLAEAAALLKTKVVKGRAPSAAPVAPVNPNKVVKTCPCCFRQIAVVSGSMAHHGYQRPGYGSQTASCAGIRFRPLEESSEGLEWLIQQTQQQLDSVTGAYATRGERTQLTVLHDRKLVDVKIDDPEWARAFQAFVYHTESEMRSLTEHLETCRQKLAKWEAWRAEAANAGEAASLPCA